MTRISQISRLLSHVGLSRSNCRGFVLSTSVWGGREWSGVLSGGEGMDYLISLAEWSPLQGRAFISPLHVSLAPLTFIEPS